MKTAPLQLTSWLRRWLVPRLVPLAAAAVVVGASACNPLDLLPSRNTSANEDDDAAAVASGSRTAAGAPTQAPPAPPIAGLGGLPSFSALVTRAKPAVVLVRAWRSRGGDEKPGLGTGFVYDPRGYLLTNNHVIEGSVRIEVRMADGKELLATVVGADKPTDVAVLKVKASGLAALPLGDSKALEVGDWVVAIGNPFGLEHTVSAGILSAKGRTRSDVRGLDPTGYFNFLQTDASINPGNSGGPLLNLAGQVVGINAAVRANANSIGFAIPMEMVHQLLPLLLKDGRVRRSAIGIYVDPVSQRQIERLKLATGGAKVRKVQPGQAGDKAGLVAGDIIVLFDGHTVKGPDELRWLASIAGVGSRVKLDVLRDGEKKSLTLKLGALD